MDLPIAEHVLRLTQELNLRVAQATATAQLLPEGATVPFIAPLPQGGHRRARRGARVLAIRDPPRADEGQVDERRAAILASLKERNLLSLPRSKRPSTPPTP